MNTCPSCLTANGRTHFCTRGFGHAGLHTAEDHDGKPSWQDESADSKPDPINHPKHYNSHPSGIECITVAEHHNFNIGNVLKYIWRAGLKDGETSVRDLRKAAWYLTREITRLDKA